MTRNLGTRIGACLLVGATVLTTAACGDPKIEREPTEEFVVDTVEKQNDFKPTDMTCPDGLQAEVGVVFDCQFTGPESTRYLAHLEIVGVSGEDVTFNLKGLEPTA